MKKIIVVTIILVITLFNVNAQINKTDGPIITGNKLDVQSIIGVDNTRFYIYLEDGENVVIQGFNKKTLAKEWETKLNVDFKTNTIYDWYTNKPHYLKNGKIYVFMPVIDEKQDKGVLFYSVLDTDGKIITNCKQIASLDDCNHRIIAGMTGNRACIFDCSISPDSSKFLFVLLHFAEAKMAVVDLKTETQTYDINPWVHRKHTFVISNDAKIAYDDDNEIEGEGRYLFVLANIYDPKTKSTKKIEVNTAEKKQIGIDAGLLFTNNNKLIITSILTDNKKNKDVKQANSGFYVSQIDMVTYKKDYETFQYFSDAWRDKYKPEKLDNGWSGDWLQPRTSLYNNGNDRFIFTAVDNGYAISVCRLKKTLGVSSWKITGTAVVKVTTLGKIEWIKELPLVLKPNSRIAGYIYCAYSNKKLNYFYNDHVKNEKIIDVNNVEGSKEPENINTEIGSDINTICLSYDMAGKATRTIIQNNKESGFYPLYNTVWLEKNKLLVYFVDKKGEHFSALTLQ